MTTGNRESDRVVACPACRRPAVFSPANRWRPFCSERCKLIDLGQWASERYRIAVDEPDEGLPEDRE